MAQRTSGPEPGRFSPSWLALREPADARARAGDLAAALAARLVGRSQLVIHDLGSGTGSMGRWLAPLLPGPQHWVLHDRDPDLLELALADPATAAADGSAVTVAGRPGDVGRLTAEDLAEADLVTTSALLDLLTQHEVASLAAACAGARCPALLTLTVAGRVELRPADPQDGEVSAAFNAHQRCSTGGRRLLGPDAVAGTIQAFSRLGGVVQVRPSPWQLGDRQLVDADLVGLWLRGWVGAAAEQRPDLRLDGYLADRLDAAGSGRLGVTVHHQDILMNWG
jgi:hypothetical protein